MIKELLSALLLKQGMKSDNHECLIAFMKKHYPKYEYENGIIYQLKEVRNKLSYDAATVRKIYIEQNKLEFNHIVKLLKELIGSDSQLDGLDCYEISKSYYFQYNLILLWLGSTYIGISLNDKKTRQPLIV